MKLFDLESNGLLDTVTRVHCLVIKDLTTDRLYRCIPSGFPMQAEMTIEEGLKLLSSGPIGGHNVIKYDIPVLKKLYPDWTYDQDTVFDTLVGTRLIWSNVKDIDNGLLKKKQLPGLLYGSHSLEAWGYRLKLMKGEYAAEFKARMGDDYEEGMEWRELSQEMLDYCVQDVVVTEALYKKILDKNYSPIALELEHQVAWLIAKQERNGFRFDTEKAAALYAKLAQRRGELERELKDYFRFWFAPAGKVVPPKTRRVFIEDPEGPITRNTGTKAKPKWQTGRYEEFTAGQAYTKIKLVEFNPGSRDHIADRLTKLYGWEPEVFTDGGKPKVDEETVANLPFPPIPLITEYLTVAKRISQLAEGDQAWLKVEKAGFIHGSVNTNGAITGRATHAFPNIAQVPAPGSLYGPECRDLFCAPPGWLLGGTDASGLELRCLAHFMARYDGGAYGEILLNGDIHWANTQAMGLTAEDRDESSKIHKTYRDGSKTFIYGFLYGAGDEKAGRIVWGIILKLKQLGLPYEALKAHFFGKVEVPTSEDLKSAGKKLKASFLKKTPALKRLIEAVREAAKKGYLIGLDKRQLHVRSAHSALNTLLQSAGALVCKFWIVQIDKIMQAKGLKHGWDGDYAFSAWVHDEVCVALRDESVAEVFKEASREAMKRAEEFFGFRCPLDVDVKIGRTWYDIH